MSHDYAFRGWSKLGGAKCPWAVSITAIRANEAVRRGTRQTSCIFNLVEPLSPSNIYFVFGERGSLSSFSLISSRNHRGKIEKGRSGGGERPSI